MLRLLTCSTISTDHLRAIKDELGGRGHGQHINARQSPPEVRPRCVPAPTWCTLAPPLHGQACTAHATRGGPKSINCTEPGASGVNRRNLAIHQPLPCPCLKGWQDMLQYVVQAPHRAQAASWAGMGARKARSGPRGCSARASSGPSRCGSRCARCTPGVSAPGKYFFLNALRDHQIALLRHAKARYAD